MRWKNIVHKHQEQWNDDPEFIEITKQEIEYDKQQELIKVDAINRKKKRIEVGRSQTRKDLERIARERGYKRSWVWVQCKLKGIKY